MEKVKLFVWYTLSPNQLRNVYELLAANITKYFLHNVLEAILRFKC